MTWPSFKRYVLDALDADLALVVSTDGIRKSTQSADGFAKNAKYIWEVQDPFDNNYRFYYDDIAERCFHRSFGAESARLIGQSLPNQWLGLIKESGHPAGSGMLMFFRWVALQRMEKLGILPQYQTIVVTRSDYLYLAPHPPVKQIEVGTLLIPE